MNSFHDSSGLWDFAALPNFRNSCRGAGQIRDTSWPRGFFQKDPKKRLEVHYYWKLPRGRLVEKIANAVARHKEEAIRS
jgi:hypothetical protein